MSKSIEKENHLVEQLLRNGTDLLKLPSTASSVLSVLYRQRCENGSPLSMKAISKETGLSITTISSLCTILESSGILDRQTQFGHSGRGRKKLLFSMRMNLHVFLSFCIRKHLNEIERISTEMKLRKLAPNRPTTELAFITRASAEAELFLSEHIHFLRESNSSVAAASVEQDWDCESSNVEGVF